MIAAVAALSSSIAAAGAWVPKPGSGYSKLSYTYFEADDVFGEVEDFDEFIGQNYAYYGERGLERSNWAMFGTVLLQDLEQTNPAGEETSSFGVGDVELGLRYQWTKDSPWVFSNAAIVKLPWFYNQDDQLPRGNGQLDWEFRALLGRSIGRLGYFGLEAGYRFRTEEPSDEIRYLVEYGFNLTPNLYFRTKLDGIESANNADEDNSGDGGSGNATLTPEFDLAKHEITLGWNFNRRKSGNQPGVEFTYTNDAYGDNTIQGESYQLGYTITY